MTKDNDVLLRKAKPQVSKNSAGYYLWNIWDGEKFDICKLLVGSQGTLGIITEIRMRLVKPERYSKMLVIFLKDLSLLGKIIPRILKEKPDAEKLNAKTNCPKCKSGEIIKGKTAYGCSAYQQGCNFKIPFELFGKKLSEKQIFTLIQKGKTSIIKGFTVNNNKEDGILILNNNFDVSFEKKEEKSTKEKAEKPEILVCPKCKKGKMIKGKTAWGCSAYKEGCTFIIPFEMLQKSYNSEILTKKVLDEIVSGNKKLF